MLGFTAVYDYAEGKSDWMASALPVEGEMTLAPYAFDVLDRDPAVCSPDDPASTLKNFGIDGRCFVLDDQGVVLGAVRKKDAARHGDEPAHTWMTEGPTTIRANERIVEFLPRMVDANVRLLPVTDPAGVLLGVVRAADALKLWPEHEHEHQHAESSGEGA
jgi:CBS domain-containing protein